MLMSDLTIGALLADGELTIDPLGEDAIQPCSVDVRLDDLLLLFRDVDEIDPQERQELTFPKQVSPVGFSLMPGEFVLGTTMERVDCSAGYALTFTGKSSLARLGLTVHQTAGHVDPGFSGRITLEISNVNKSPIRLRPGMWIGQILVAKLDLPAARPYGHPDRRSRYQGQSTVTASRSWL